MLVGVMFVHILALCAHGTQVAVNQKCVESGKSECCYPFIIFYSDAVSCHLQCVCFLCYFVDLSSWSTCRHQQGAKKWNTADRAKITKAGKRTSG